MYEVKNGRLQKDGDAFGFSNHSIGSRQLGWSAILDVNGHGIPDIALPNTNRRTLRAVSFAGGFQKLAAAPVGGRLYPGTPHETVMQTNVFTRRGTERIIRAAFEHCVKRNKKNLVTSVTKSNAQTFGMVFWDEVFEAVAAEYPQIQTESLLVDRVAMDLVRWPEAFDVMVASNLFADIISDIAAVATGSMGLAASANINLEGIYPSMFESVHGAAFDIAGQGIANPLATISAVAMMLDHLGEPDSARRVEAAVMRSLEEGRIVTGDLGGSASTAQVGDEVVRLLGEG